MIRMSAVVPAIRHERTELVIREELQISTAALFLRVYTNVQIYFTKIALFIGIENSMRSRNITIGRTRVAQSQIVVQWTEMRGDS
jgi:hypothetical protein